MAMKENAKTHYQGAVEYNEDKGEKEEMREDGNKVVKEEQEREKNDEVGKNGGGGAEREQKQENEFTSQKQMRLVK